MIFEHSLLNACHELERQPEETEARRLLLSQEQKDRASTPPNSIALDRRIISG